MNKIIIENRTDLSDLVALQHIYSVIDKGRISNFGKQYCYCSTFEVNKKEVVVWTYLNKKSDRFVIEYGG